MSKLVTEVTIDSHIDTTNAALIKAINRGLNAIGLTAEGYAKTDCPVKTGRLRNSITYATSDYGGNATYTDNNGKSFSDGASRGRPKEGEVIIGTNVEYAPVIENGGVNRAARHFLRNAASQHTDEYKRLMEDSLKAANV